MERPTPCQPSPCGPNAVCREQSGAGSCRCIEDYIGNPYEGCRPECVLNTDCPPNKACLRSKCQDPCPGTCGSNADCQVVSHLASCTCRPGFTGDPFRSCFPTPPQSKIRFRSGSLFGDIFTYLILQLYLVVQAEPQNPCVPSPCGPNSQCRQVNGQAVCSCLPEYSGSPPNCRPECVSSSECSQEKACINQKCKDPCPGVCGTNAKCRTINHSPICSCIAGYTGDPFSRCSPIPRKKALSFSVICFLNVSQASDVRSSFKLLRQSKRRP